MSSRLIQVLLALSLLLNTFVLMGFVYRSWITPPPFERPTPPPAPRPGALETVTHDLNLDEGQRQALRGAFDQYAVGRRERLHEIQRLREQLASEYKRPSIDMTRVDALIDQLTKLRADMQKETLRAFTQLETQLKPEQRERMHQILAERLASPPVGRPPGAGAGPGAARPPQ
ncbi:MAG TPA: periplasmic heavy metal sensor [Reyranella sp.]|jgi:Spy/CpxP family protein refolding chaperone